MFLIFFIIFVVGFCVENKFWNWVDSHFDNDNDKDKFVALFYFILSAVMALISSVVLYFV